MINPHYLLKSAAGLPVFNGSVLKTNRSEAFSNSIRKQYGHPVFFAKLDFESNADMTREFPIPPLLPPHGIEDSSTTMNSRSISKQNLHALQRFLKDFVTMNLIPWMEKSTLGWIELVSTNYPSNASTNTIQFPTRRLTSRLFSSTRRLFGTPQNHVQSNHDSLNTSANAPGTAMNLQRRLAEFATILGDYKVALAVWDAMRKENRGGLVRCSLVVAPIISDIRGCRTFSCCYLAMNHQNMSSMLSKPLPN
jgi:hypothetical protein